MKAKNKPNMSAMSIPKARRFQEKALGIFSSCLLLCIAPNSVVYGGDKTSYFDQGIGDSKSYWLEIVAQASQHDGVLGMEAVLPNRETAEVFSFHFPQPSREYTPAEVSLYGQQIKWYYDGALFFIDQGHVFLKTRKGYVIYIEGTENIVAVDFYRGVVAALQKDGTLKLFHPYEENALLVAKGVKKFIPAGDYLVVLTQAGEVWIHFKGDMGDIDGSLFRRYHLYRYANFPFIKSGFENVISMDETSENIRLNFSNGEFAEISPHEFYHQLVCLPTPPGTEKTRCLGQ